MNNSLKILSCNCTKNNYDSFNTQCDSLEIEVDMATSLNNVFQNIEIDILCIQGCDNPDIFVQVFKKNNVLVRKCGSFVMAINPTCVKKVDKVIFLPFEKTRQNNGLAYFNIEIKNGKTITIITSAFDSLGENSVNRKSQLAQLINFFPIISEKNKVLAERLENKKRKEEELVEDTKNCIEKNLITENETIISTENEKIISTEKEKIISTENNIIFIGDTSMPSWQTIDRTTQTLIDNFNIIDPFYTIGTNKDEDDRQNKCLYNCDNYECVSLQTIELENLEKKLFLVTFRSI